MKKIVLVVIFYSLILVNASSQCPPGGITFVNQSAIDNFQINFPNCTEINGAVTINGDDITNLDGLSVLNSISGYLYINNCPTLISITGLSGLTNIGGYLNVWACPILPSLTGLHNVPSIGGYLVIALNDSITSLTGLDNITSVEGYISIWFNDVLTNLTGLDNLSSVGGNIEIIENDTLESLVGLENVSSIGGYLLIEDNKYLTSLIGLNNLTSINGYLDIYNNDILPSLTALENLNSISGILSIRNNYLLTSLAGLDNIEAASIIGLGIYYNYILSTCEVESVCDYLAISGGNIDIHNNAAGCNNQTEVEDACGIVLLNQSIFSNNIIISPNPLSTSTTIEFEILQPSKVIFSIFNNFGKQVKVIQQKSNSGKQQLVWNAQGLPSGMYFFRLQAGDQVAQGKISVVK